MKTAIIKAVCAVLGLIGTGAVCGAVAMGFADYPGWEGVPPKVIDIDSPSLAIPFIIIVAMIVIIKTIRGSNGD